MNTNEQPADEAVRLLDESQLLIPFSRERSFEETKNQARILIQKCIERATGAEYGRGVSNGKLEALQYTPEERERYGKIVAQAEFYAAQTQPSKGSPASGEWECPECKTLYISNVGTCGNNLDCSRPNVVPVQRTEPRGQQQEWTKRNGRNHIEILTVDRAISGGDAITVVQNEVAADCLIDAHNAALADERQRREQAERDNKRLKDQWELTNQDLRNTKQRELSALAAIEKKHSALYDLLKGRNATTEANALKALDYVDLSALHKHVAEVREPLVELLQEVRPTIQNAADDPSASPWQREIRLKFIAKIDALANVKEQ